MELPENLIPELSTKESQVICSITEEEAKIVSVELSSERIEDFNILGIQGTKTTTKTTTYKKIY